VTGQVIQSKARRQLLLLIGLFLLPPIAAWLAWQYLGEHGVGATTNTGTLISPARPLHVDALAQSAGLDAAQLQGRWLYVVLSEQGCDSVCQRQLYLTRQVRIAVNKDTKRVKRLLLLGHAPDPTLLAKLQLEQPDLLLGVLPKAQVDDAFAGDKYGVTGKQFYLVDPLGNLMMYYDDSVNPKGILRDLQKLLKVSQVG
jgi:hypothetical protein